MTNVKLQVTEHRPIYREYKTKPPKLLRIEKTTRIEQFMSHDTDQAHIYANRFIEQCRARSKADANYDYEIEPLGVEYL